MLIFLIIVLFLAYFILFQTNVLEHFSSESRINYVSKEYFQDIIKKDNYFQRMNAPDLIARKVKTKEEYQERYLTSIEQFDDLEKNHIEVIINLIDRMTKKYRNIHKIPWKLAKINSDLENAYPHTINDVIVLNKNSFSRDLMNTLMHEKVHIYQKLYPEFTRIYIEQERQYAPTNILEINNNRNNPDEDGLLYANGYGKIPLTLYNSDHPKDLTDVSYVYNTNGILTYAETNDDGHPNETMARDITNFVLSDFTPSYWMVNYL